MASHAYLWSLSPIDERMYFADGDPQVFTVSDRKTLISYGQSVCRIEPNKKFFKIDDYYSYTPEVLDHINSFRMESCLKPITMHQWADMDVGEEESQYLCRTAKRRHKDAFFKGFAMGSYAKMKPTDSERRFIGKALLYSLGDSVTLIADRTPTCRVKGDLFFKLDDCPPLVDTLKQINEFRVQAGFEQIDACEWIDMPVNGEKHPSLKSEGMLKKDRKLLNWFRGFFG